MHKLYMNVFRWKKAAIGTKAALVGGPQLIFFCRVPALATGSLAAASFPFLSGIGSSISRCPPIRMASRMETAQKIGADEQSFAVDAIMGRLAKQAEPRIRAGRK